MTAISITVRKDLYLLQSCEQYNSSRNLRSRQHRNDASDKVFELSFSNRGWTPQLLFCNRLNQSFILGDKDFYLFRESQKGGYGAFKHFLISVLFG